MLWWARVLTLLLATLVVGLDAAEPASTPHLRGRAGGLHPPGADADADALGPHETSPLTPLHYIEQSERGHLPPALAMPTEAGDAANTPAQVVSLPEKRMSGASLERGDSRPGPGIRSPNVHSNHAGLHAKRGRSRLYGHRHSQVSETAKRGFGAVPPPTVPVPAGAFA